MEDVRGLPCNFCKLQILLSYPKHGGIACKKRLQDSLRARKGGVQVLERILREEIRLQDVVLTF